MHRKLVGLTLFLLILTIFPVENTLSQELTLAVYELDIDEEYLDLLNADPSLNNAYPAVLTYDNTGYDCEVRYRGTTARNLPKKSWKIDFDGPGPESWDEINLNAEYRDLSFSRNFLAMRLAEYAGIPAPATDFVSLVVNDQYYGVHVQVEQVNDDFLERNELDVNGSLFKAVSNGCRFAPPINIEDITDYYEKKEGPPYAVDTLRARIAYITYAHPSEAAGGIEMFVDVDEVLTHFSLQVAISNLDGMAKNYYLHQDTDDLYRIIPWDMDASFGNDWQGNLIEENVSRTWFFGLNEQTLFQRLIEDQVNRNFVLDKIEWLTETGFDSLQELLDNTAELIRNDVYLDTLKLGTNEEFEQAILDLEDFLSERRDHIDNISFARPRFDWFSIEPEYLDNQTDSVFVQVAGENFQNLVQISVHNLENLTRHNLNDDGLNGDLVPDDGILSGYVDVVGNPLYYTITSGSTYHWPASGMYSFPHVQLSQPSIRMHQNPPQSGDFQVDNEIYQGPNGSFILSIQNNALYPKNLSGCMVQVNEDFRMMRFGEVETMDSGDSILVTNHVVWASSLFPTSNVAGCLDVYPQEGDEISLFTPSGVFLASSQISSTSELEEGSANIIINEINYNSSNDVDPGDWVEIYCVNGSEDLTGWELYDQNDENCFEFPEELTIDSHEFMVIARSPDSFSEVFPNVENVYGPMSFGFNRGGDEIRIYNPEGNLIDWVAYDDDEPWPGEPDGNGPTLELLAYTLPNSDHTNWRASETDFGTPGDTNSINGIHNYTPPAAIPETYKILSAFPNPFNNTVNINVLFPTLGEYKIVIYNTLGRQVAAIDGSVPTYGQHSIYWKGSNQGKELASGVYYVRMENPEQTGAYRIVLLK